MTESVIRAKGDRLCADGMYETHEIVMAESPPLSEPKDGHPTIHGNSSGHRTGAGRVSVTTAQQGKRSVLFDATRGVLVLSSKLILLPFRLMTLALSLLGRGHHTKGALSQQERQRLLLQQSGQRRIRSVLWYSESPIGDLSGSLLLLLLQNHRCGAMGSNHFREALASLHDNRWEDKGNGASSIDKPMSAVAAAQMADRPPPGESFSTPSQSQQEQQQQQLSMNFELLFESFGRTVHNELGALLLYTFYQASPSFAASLSVRSDLDTLLVPLLRTLYFSSSTRHYSASKSGHPFRSPSQLYVVLIMLLLFSQDSSFGPDAFHRITMESVRWYRERSLNNISLGSLLVLVLLRCITFNLNRLQDAFLLSNCCAVLMNLSPHMVSLHEYAAMRLAAVAVSSLKKYKSMKARNGTNNNNGGEDEDLSTPLGMHGEVVRTLLSVVRHCLRPKHIETNINLVFALLYHQAEWNDGTASILGKTATTTTTTTTKPPHNKQKADRGLSGDVSCIDTVIQAGMTIVDEQTTGSDSRSAPKVQQALRANTERLRTAATGPGKQDKPSDFVFSYEEEADPELFFVPYVWEIIVGAVTSGSIEWHIHSIQVFSLLEDDAMDENGLSEDNPVEVGAEANRYSKDIDSVV